MAGAHVLHSRLSMLRPDVHLVFEHSISRDLCGAARGDAAVILDFARYRRTPMLAAGALVDEGVDLIAITDGPLSPLASMTQNWCQLRIPAVGPFDSSLPAVLAAELIVARVADELGDAGRDRIDRLERLWQQTATYLEYTPRIERPGKEPGDVGRGHEPGPGKRFSRGWGGSACLGARGCRACALAERKGLVSLATRFGRTGSPPVQSSRPSRFPTTGARLPRSAYGAQRPAPAGQSSG